MATEEYWVCRWPLDHKFYPGDFAGLDANSSGYPWPASKSPVDSSVHKMLTEEIAKKFACWDLTVHKITVNYVVE